MTAMTGPQNKNESAKSLKRQKKVAFVCNRYHTNMSPVLRALEDSGLKTAVFCNTGKGVSAGDRCVNVYSDSKASMFIANICRVTEVSNRGKYQVPNLLRLISDLYGFWPDVIVLRVLRMPICVLSLLFGVIVGARIVVSTQDPIHSSRSRLSKKFFYRALKIIGVRAYSPVLGSPCADASPLDIAFIPFCMPGDVRQRIRDPQDKKVRFLAVGKFVERKGFRDLLEQLGRLSRFDNWDLHWVGEVTTQEHEAMFDSCKKIIESKSLESKVVISKNVPHDRMSDLYLSADVFLLPSFREPASISQFEAMQFGLPAIVMSDNGTAYVVDSGRTGFIVDSAAEMVQKMEYFVVNPEAVTIFGSEARRRVEVGYTGDYVCGEFLRLFGF